MSDNQFPLEIDGADNLGSIVHIGAGKGGDLKTYLHSSAQKILLVEPNPELIPLLEQSAKQDDRITVLPVAVSDTPERSVFRLLNYPSLSSLRKPDGAFALFPGLKQTAEINVNTITIQELLQKASLTPDATHLLIVDAPGEQGMIINTLIEQDQLILFKYIILCGGRDALHEESIGITEISARLQKNGYRLAWEKSNDDPAFIDTCLVLDPLWLENRQLQSELDMARQHSRSLESNLKNAEESIAALKSEKEAQLQAYRISQEQNTASEQRILKLQTNIDALNAETVKRIDNIEKENAEKQKEIQNLKEKLTQETDALRKENRLSLRMQSMIQSDLRDLQNRYENVLQQKNKQETLLKELTPRLQAASHHLHDMLNAQTSEPKELRPLTKPQRGKGN